LAAVGGDPEATHWPAFPGISIGASFLFDNFYLRTIERITKALATLNQDGFCCMFFY
jgi:hypothetical protein